MPSAPQKRFCANGRSFDTFTTVAPLPAASSLNFRTLVAHTGVSTDGKMFSNTGLPLNWSLLRGLRSAPVSAKLGAEDPTAGNSPTVLIAFPRRVICAIAPQSAKARAATVGQVRHVLICGVHGVDDMTRCGQH